MKDKYIHLTNDAIQKKCEDYGKYEIGNKLSFLDLENYFKSTYCKGDFSETVIAPMKRLTEEFLEATYDKLNPVGRDFCFQIFGLDFMIDENFKIWLIEVNNNPCLETHTALLYKIISSMIENAFKIAVDPIFRGTKESIKNNRWMDKEPFKNNKFSVIFDRKVEKAGFIEQTSSLEEDE